MDLITLGLLITAVAEGLVILGFIWKVAAKYGELKHGIESNRNDLNNAFNTLRSQIRNQDYLLQSQISHIQEHCSRTSDYHPPTLRTFEGD